MSTTSTIFSVFFQKKLGQKGNAPSIQAENEKQA